MVIVTQFCETECTLATVRSRNFGTKYAKTCLQAGEFSRITMSSFGNSSFTLIQVLNMDSSKIYLPGIINTSKLLQNTWNYFHYRWRYTISFTKIIHTVHRVRHAISLICASDLRNVALVSFAVRVCFYHFLAIALFPNEENFQLALNILQF